MIDQVSPPFRAGDVAYTQPAPGGYVNDAAVPVPPAGDVAYTVPALGGEFEPGSGTQAPTTSPVGKGADADGGAQKIKDAPRIDPPEPETPPVVPDLSVTVSGPTAQKALLFAGATKLVGKTVTVNYQVGTGAFKDVIVDIPAQTTAGTAAALVAAELAKDPELSVSSTSNQLTVQGHGANSLSNLTAAVGDPTP